MKLSEQEIKTRLGVTRKQLAELVKQGKVVKNSDGSYTVQ